jgi:glycosyltransferase involved in cell wall biosynthesis
LKRQEKARVAVVNFNAPELYQLAAALATAGLLQVNCGPYANKGRYWERSLERFPYIGAVYKKTFDRRRIAVPDLVGRTVELGVVADLAAAAVARAGFLPSTLREGWKDRLYERMRVGIAEQSPKYISGATHVVAYPGCAREAFKYLRRAGGKAMLNYPIAHHAYHLRVRNEEAERWPEFSNSWLAFEDRGQEYIDILDAECKEADRILVGSSFVRDTFVSQGIDSDKIDIVPYGVDTRLFDRVPRDQQRKGMSLLFAGQISQRKGLSYLFEAYEMFRKPDTTLTLVGRYVGTEAIWTRYRSLYTHIDHLTRPALAEVYGGSDVFVFPSLLEGMPLVVLEAMASGLPVIVTPNGCSDIVRDGIDGFVVPPRDSVTLQERLERLYAEPELRRQMGENARERALTYTWSRYTEALIELMTGDR